MLALLHIDYALATLTSAEPDIVKAGKRRVILGRTCAEQDFTE